MSSAAGLAPGPAGCSSLLFPEDSPGRGRGQRRASVREGARLPRAEMEVTAFHSPSGKAFVALPRGVWWWGGGQWNHKAPAGSPEGWPPAWCPGPRVLCSSPDVWASLPTWCPEGEWGFPSWKQLVAEPSARGGWLGWDFEWARLPAALALPEEFCIPRPPQRPPRPSLLFQGCLLRRAGVAHGWGRGTRGVVETGVLCMRREPSPPAAGGCARGQRLHPFTWVTARVWHPPF